MLRLVSQQVGGDGSSSNNDALFLSTSFLFLLVVASSTLIIFCVSFCFVCMEHKRKALSFSSDETRLHPRKEKVRSKKTTNRCCRFAAFGSASQSKFVGPWCTLGGRSIQKQVQDR